MITKIVAKLKTGKIKNVVPFGSGNLPAAPYVVVKMESDGLGRGRLVRIIAHMLPGQNTFLEDYIFNDVSVLLEGFETTSRHGNRNVLETENEYTDIVANNDDGTISMERRFILPSRIF